MRLQNVSVSDCQVELIKGLTSLRTDKYSLFCLARTFLIKINTFLEMYNRLPKYSKLLYQSCRCLGVNEQSREVQTIGLKYESIFLITNQKPHLFPQKRDQKSVFSFQMIGCVRVVGSTIRQSRITCLLSLSGWLSNVGTGVRFSSQFWHLDWRPEIEPVSGPLSLNHHLLSSPPPVIMQIFPEIQT